MQKNKYVRSALLLLGPFIFTGNAFADKKSDSPKIVVAMPKEDREIGLCLSLLKYSKECKFTLNDLAKMDSDSAETLLDQGLNNKGKTLSLEESYEILRKLPLSKAGAILNKFLNFDKSQALFALIAQKDAYFAAKLLLAIRDADFGKTPEGVPTKTVPTMAVILMKSISSQKLVKRILNNLKNKDANYGMYLEEELGTFR